MAKIKKKNISDISNIPDIPNIPNIPLPPSKGEWPRTPSKGEWPRPSKGECPCTPSKGELPRTLDTFTAGEDEDFSSVYLNPLTDFGFKKIFLNKELLMAFLNDIVGTEINDITYLPTEGIGNYKYERTAIFDLLCQTNQGEFIIEMQLGKQTYFKDRSLFYTSHVIRKQAPRKKYWNYELKPVYIVAILDFIIFDEKQVENEVIERVQLCRKNTGTLFSDKLNMVFIELPKFDKQPSELQNNTETWLYLLKNTFFLTTCPPEIKGRIFKLFLKTAELKHLTPAEMETYSTSLKRNLYLRDIAHCAKMEGRMDERKQFALKLLKKGASYEEVIDLTELSKEQVIELLNQLPKS